MRRPPAEADGPDQDDDDGSRDAERDVVPAQLGDAAVECRVGRPLLGDREPEQQVEQHTGAAEHREYGENDAEDDRIHTEVRAQPTADADAVAVGAATAQQFRRRTGGSPAGTAGRGRRRWRLGGAVRCVGHGCRHA
jgi:hypothetical protein